MNYELKLEQYSGPLEKLLELIEERKLEVTEISLGQVTEDFLRHLNDLKAKTGALQEGDPVEHSVRAHLRLLVDFIIVASRLILIKSKSLLPGLELSGEEEADIKDLERRLFIYKELKPAMRLIASLWKSPAREFSRPYLLSMSQTLAARGEGRFFYPGNMLTSESLAASLSPLLETLEKLTYETKTIKEKIVTIEEEMKTVLGRLEKIGNSSFSALSKSRSRGDVVVMFLALLHLCRDQMISLEQESRFSDIMIGKKQTSSAQ